MVGRATRYILLSLVIAYAADWGVFELRRARGTAMGSVTVEQYLKTPLKGHKEEFDYQGTAQESCSRTLFPQYAESAWNPPCWWLARHRTHWQTVTVEWPYPPSTAAR
jgi:hypothetical protein